MTPWEWWAEALFDDERESGEFNIGPEDTRDAIIAAAMRETRPGDRFVIIEARSSEDMRHEGDDIVPFLRTRNKETLTNGPHRVGGCAHDFQGWREFADGLGGERVCSKCGLGAMAYTLSLEI